MMVATKLENVGAQTWDGQRVKPRNISRTNFIIPACSLAVWGIKRFSYSTAEKDPN